MTHATAAAPSSKRPAPSQSTTPAKRARSSAVKAEEDDMEDDEHDQLDDDMDVQTLAKVARKQARVGRFLLCSPVRVALISHPLDYSQSRISSTFAQPTQSPSRMARCASCRVGSRKPSTAVRRNTTPDHIHTASIVFCGPRNFSCAECLVSCQRPGHSSRDRQLVRRHQPRLGSTTAGGSGCQTRCQYGSGPITCIDHKVLGRRYQRFDLGSRECGVARACCIVGEPRQAGCGARESRWYFEPRNHDYICSICHDQLCPVS